MTIGAGASCFNFSLLGGKITTRLVRNNGGHGTGVEGVKLYLLARGSAAVLCFGMFCGGHEMEDRLETTLQAFLRLSWV